MVSIVFLYPDITILEATDIDNKTGVSPVIRQGF